MALYPYLFFGCAGSLSLCVGFSLVEASRGYSWHGADFVVEKPLLQPLLLWSTGFSSCVGSWTLEPRLSSCSAQALLLRGMWNLPGTGIEPVSSELTGRILSTVPPGKSHCLSVPLKMFG